MSFVWRSTLLIGLNFSQFWPRCSLAIWLGCEESSTKLFTSVSAWVSYVQLMYKGVWKKSLFPIYISIYLANDTTYGHSYKETLTETRMRSIELWHFHWPWVTLKLNFKIMIGYSSTSHNSKMVQDKAIIDDDDDDTYAGRLVGLWSIESCHFADTESPLTQTSKESIQ